MISRAFTLEDQLAFADFSGDYNPIHIDTIAARRSIFGTPVVHGVHLLLWALERWLLNKTLNIELFSIEADFQTTTRIGEEVNYLLKAEKEGCTEIALLAEKSVTMTLKFQWRSSSGDETSFLSSGLSTNRYECRELLLSEAANASGSLQLYINLEMYTLLFPHLAKLMPSLQIAQLLATTRLVGMECPGLHSMFSSLALAFGKETHQASILTYQIIKLDKRFGLVLMKITSQKMTGTITAIFRPPPQKQIGFKELRERVNGNEFSNQNALVVGGSRGLGEVTAKLLSMGGAKVKITYHQGVEDAHRVVNEIISGGGFAENVPFDVLDNSMNIADRLGNGWVPTHLYYFATPFIASGRKRTFSASLFQNFCNYYVIGFQRIVEQLVAFGLKKVLYPSSVFVNDLPSNMGEYAAAKMAGEVLCTFLENTQQGLIIYKPRLPKMATDQTVRLTPADTRDPVLIILEHLRNLRDSSLLPPEKL